MEFSGYLSMEPRSWSWSLLDWERSWEDKDLGVAEGGSEMEGSSGGMNTSEKLDVAEADSGGSCLRKIECDRGSELDFGKFGLLGESSRYQRHVSSC